MMYRILRATGVAALLAVVISAGAAPVAQAQSGKPDPQTSPIERPPTDVWAVQLSPSADPGAVAAAVGAVNLGQIGALEGYYEFLFTASAMETRIASVPLEESPAVLWFEQQTVNPNALRDPADPLFPNQWHLRNTGQGGGTTGEDANVVAAWDEGYTGTGVIIGIVEGGVDLDHPDLVGNHVASATLSTGEGNINHGTSVAGVAVGNNDGASCGVGVAYDASFGSVSFGSGTDSGEAAALSHALALIDIYNNSWGPFDSGNILGAPGALAAAAIEEGITDGRAGLGAIYVWAGGNGRGSDDEVNADAYANSRYTIAVGASTDTGDVAGYSERGAALLVNAPSNGGASGITTTDIAGAEGYTSTDCEDGFGGTSAASPLVAGVVALMLEANPVLTWRDVQHILVETAEQNDPADPSWFTNGAGYEVSHDFGHGRVDAGAAVQAAETWTNVPEAQTVTSPVLASGEAIPDGAGSPGDGPPLEETYTVGGQNLTIEHVELIVNATHTFRGDLRFELISPAGTTSTLLFERSNDSGDNYTSWRMMSTHFWGEASNGEWTLRVTDTYSQDVGTLNDWQLVIHGTTNDGDAPAAPTDLVVTATGATTAALSWTDNANDETFYRVERSLDGSSGWQQVANLDADTTTHTDTGLACGTTYFYRVVAGNSSGTAASGVASTVTDGCIVVDTPITLTATQTTSTVSSLTWTDVADETGYVVELSTDGGQNWQQIAALGENTTSYSDTAMACGTQHTYRVLGTQSGIPVYLSNPATLTTLACVLDNGTFEEQTLQWTPITQGTGDGVFCVDSLSCLFVFVGGGPNALEVVRQEATVNGSPGDTITLTLEATGIDVGAGGFAGARLVVGNGQILDCFISERGDFTAVERTCQLNADTPFSTITLLSGWYRVDGGLLGIDNIQVTVD